MPEVTVALCRIGTNMNLIPGQSIAAARYKLRSSVVRFPFIILF